MTVTAVRPEPIGQPAGGSLPEMLATGRVCPGVRARGTWDDQPGPQTEAFWSSLVQAKESNVLCYSHLFVDMFLEMSIWLCSLITNLLRIKRNGNKSLA